MHRHIPQREEGEREEREREREDVCSHSELLETRQSHNGLLQVGQPKNLVVPQPTKLKVSTKFLMCTLNLRLKGTKCKVHCERLKNLECGDCGWWQQPVMCLLRVQLGHGFFFLPLFFH